VQKWRASYCHIERLPGSDGAREGGYTPDVIVVQHGKPVRLNFRREETAACSEMVIFNDFGKSAQLPTGKTVPVEFLPEKAGEYEFSCQMGMFRGKLIVE
jgi:plastocyanin domain-containing protein